MRIPTQLLGIEGSQTYANYEEARLAFYIETVLPLVDLYYSELNRWLAPAYGDNVEIFYDEESITALNPIREKNTKMKMESGVLTTNEKRELIGYEPVDEPEADQILVNTSQMPLGLDVLMEDEQDTQDIANALKRAGIDNPVQKAFDIIEEKSTK
jgi:phage portal protein BeeE